jgi:hypothetical protein
MLYVCVGGLSLSKLHDLRIHAMQLQQVGPPLDKHQSHHDREGGIASMMMNQLVRRVI